MLDYIFHLFGFYGEPFRTFVCTYVTIATIEPLSANVAVRWPFVDHRIISILAFHELIIIVIVFVIIAHAVGTQLLQSRMRFHMQFESGWSIE